MGRGSSNVLDRSGRNSQFGGKCRNDRNPCGTLKTGDPSLLRYPRSWLEAWR